MLILCDGCKRHVRAEHDTCPFCGASRDRSPVWTPTLSARSRAACLVGGLMIASSGAGCEKSKPTIEPVTAAPPYGMTVSPTHDVAIPIPVVADAGAPSVGGGDAGATDAGAARAADAGSTKAPPTSAAPLYGMPPDRPKPSR